MRPLAWEPRYAACSALKKKKKRYKDTKLMGPSGRSVMLSMLLTGQPGVLAAALAPSCHWLPFMAQQVAALWERCLWLFSCPTASLPLCGGWLRWLMAGIWGELRSGSECFQSGSVQRKSPAGRDSIGEGPTGSHQKMVRGSSCCSSVVTSPTSIHEDAGSSPGLAQWFKDLALP